MEIKVNGTYAAENAVELLDAQEQSLRWGGERDEAAVRRLARETEHFSAAGTEILRRCRPDEEAVVIDDGEGRAYVIACDPPLPPRRLRRGRFGRWLQEAPTFHYAEWRPARNWWLWDPQDGSSNDGRASLYRGLPIEKGRFRIGGLTESVRWLRSLPLLRYIERPVPRWRIAAWVENYYVEPGFYEDVDATDLADDLLEHYPEPVGSSLREWEPEIDPRTGRASFLCSEAALRYAGDLMVAMDRIGVVCSPSVGIGSYTDLRGPKHPGSDPEDGGEHHSHGLPVPEPEKIDGLVWKLRMLDHYLRRCAELENRLSDPRIPDRRKTQIERMLQEERELEREAQDGLREVDPARIYGLVISLANECDRLSRRNSSMERILKSRTDLLRQLGAL